LASEKKSADAFEAALKRAVQNAPSSRAQDCPAPEILAAYYDRSLTRTERARIDAHLVSCARCQSMMAAIARADDSETSSAHTETARGIFWITRLLAPVAVVGVVIAIAIGMRSREQRAPEVIALASPVAELQQLAERAPAPPPEAAVPAQSAPQVASAPPSAASMEIPKAEGFARREKAMKKSESSSARDFISRGDEIAAQAKPRNAPGEAANEMRAPGAASGSAFSGATGMMAKGSRLNQVSSPDGSVAWRFGESGTIMRSGSSTTWIAQHSGVTSDLLAAAAPSNDVCWIVGKSATIVRTLDGGAHWQIVKASSRDDFTAVSASDSNNATVSGAGGQRYVTHDGGVTWSSL